MRALTFAFGCMHACKKCTLAKMHFSLDMPFRRLTYRSKNCKYCENCLRPNCKSCLNCTTPSRKQKCIFRECLNPEPKRVENNIIYETENIKILPKLFQPNLLEDISKEFVKKIVDNTTVKESTDTVVIVNLVKYLIMLDKTYSTDSLLDKNHAF